MGASSTGSCRQLCKLPFIAEQITLFSPNATMTAKLKYISDLPLYQEEKPFTLYGFPDDIVPQSNCHFETRDDVRVNNARGREADFTLDNCGFEFHTAPSKCRLTAHVFENHSEREAVWQYLKETIDFTQHHLQATKALCFDWRVSRLGSCANKVTDATQFRRSGADCGVNGQLNDLENARYRALAPATLMHCGIAHQFYQRTSIFASILKSMIDFSFQGGLETLEIHLSDEEFQELADGRARMKIIKYEIYCIATVD